MSRWLIKKQKVENHKNAMRVKAAEGQSKVIRLSISNPFSSLWHWVPFKQANDKAVIQDNSVCMEQRKNYGVEISHCSHSLNNEIKKRCGLPSLYLPPSLLQVLWNGLKLKLKMVNVLVASRLCLSLLQHYVEIITFYVADGLSSNRPYCEHQKTS